MISSAPPIATTLDLPHPYLLFLGDVVEAGFAKTALPLSGCAIAEFAALVDSCLRD